MKNTNYLKKCFINNNELNFHATFQHEILNIAYEKNAFSFKPTITVVVN